MSDYLVLLNAMAAGALLVAALVSILSVYPIPTFVTHCGTF